MEENVIIIIIISACTILFIFMLLIILLSVNNTTDVTHSSQCITKSGKCNEVGFMKSNGKTIPCSPTCKISIWNIEDTSECINGIKTITQKCIPNDAYGINSCMYNYIPETTSFSGDCSLQGTIMTCQVGAYYTYTQPC